MGGASLSFVSSVRLPVLTAALALAVFVGDTVTSLQTAFAVLYVPVVLLSARFCDARGIVLVATGCVALTVLSALLSPSGGDVSDGVANTLISIGAIALTTLIVLREAQERAERQTAEEALRRSEMYLADAQRIAHVGWWERDYRTNHVDLSDEVCRVFGVKPLDLPAWHGRWLDIIHPEDRARVAEASAAALRGGPRYDVEYRVVRPDGGVRVVHSQGEVTWDDSGRPLRQFGVLQDITELRQAERDLRASEARFRTFVDHATDAFFLFDDQSIILDVNREACNSLGYSREELIGMHPRVFDVGLDEASMQGLRQRIAAGETLTFETRHRRKDGAVFPVEIRAAQFEQGGHRQLCLVRDITDRKRAEQRLLAHHAVTRILAEAAAVDEASAQILQTLCERLDWHLGATWRIDRESDILRCVDFWCAPSIEAPRFEAAIRATSFRRGSGLPGRVWADRAPRWHADFVAEPNYQRASIAAQAGIRTAVGFPILLGSEVLGVVEFFSCDVRQPDRDILEMMETIGSQIGQFVERKRAEKALQVAQAELAHVTRVMTVTELTASVAHEVNQPIAAAVIDAGAALGFLMAQPPDVEQARQALEAILSHGRRAGEVVGRIRDFIKKAPPRKDSFDVNGAVSEVVELARSDALKRGVSVHTEFGSGLPLIVGDRVQIQQVALNLIINSIEAMSGMSDGAREVQIGTEADAAGGVRVTVRDTGPGLDPTKLDRVFERFYTTKPNGLGMGLAICRSIVEAHGGKMKAAANDPRGAVFQFILPSGRAQSISADIED